MDNSINLAAPTLVDIYDWILTGLKSTSLVHAEAGVVYPEAPGFEELQRRLALELTKLTPSMFADNETQPTGLKYYIDDGEQMQRDIDSRFGPLTAMLNTPNSLLDGHTRDPLPDPDADIAAFVPAEKRRLPADATPPRKTTLRLIKDNEREWMPVTGELCMIHTSAGFIPAGIVADSVNNGYGVKVHIYRCLLDSPNDTSFYDLVSCNELLLPPAIVPTSEFESGGSMRMTDHADAPRPVPLPAYYVNGGAQEWDPKTRQFSRAYPGVTRLDGTVRIKPATRDNITVTDQNNEHFRPLKDGEDFHDKPISSGLIVFSHILEFALEDSLSYFGLIDTPRPDMASM